MNSVPSGDVDLGLVFASLPRATAVFAVDAPRFTLLAANDALLAASHRTREALIGRPLADAFPNASLEDAEEGGLIRLRESIEAAGRTGAPQRMAQQRYDLERPDGVWEQRYWDAVNIPVRGADGAIRYVLHETEDVTARLRSEQAVSRAERRADGMLARIADAHIVLDGDFRLVDVNPAAERSLRRMREALLGRSHWEVIPKSYDTEAGRNYRRAAQEGVELHFTEHFRYDGHDVHLEMDAYPTDEGGVAVFWRDVSERISAEAALRASEARYRGLFASIDEGFCVLEVLVDADDRPVDYCFLETNPAFVRQGGFDPLAEGTPSRRMSEIAPIEPSWIAIYGGVAATGEPVRFTHEAASFGRTYDVFAFRVDAPEVRHVAVLFRDVTAQRIAEAEHDRLLADAEAARTAAEAANRAKSEFLAVMSHELRTPLNAIGGYAELIELGIHGPVTDAQRLALARIQSSQRHLLGLIAGVLDYSRVEAGAVTYRIAELPVAEVVAEAEALVAPQLRAKGLGYMWSGAPADLAVRGDREKLQQILLNLLGNAVKFTHSRGDVPERVEVACSIQNDGDGVTGGSLVRLHVRDTGDGIAADALERVFEPFVQVDQRLTRPHAGVGLGLAISRDLARGMGGDLTVVSTVGEGSTFTLTLPRA